MKKKVLSLILSAAMIITSFAGMTGLFPQIAAAAEVVTIAADGVQAITAKAVGQENTSSGPVTLMEDSDFYKDYFGEDVKAGLIKLLDAGKVIINGAAMAPTTAPEPFSINGGESLWQNEDGTWGWNTHKLFGGDNIESYADCAVAFINGVSLLRGTSFEIGLDADGKAESYNQIVWDVVTADTLEVAEDGSVKLGIVTEPTVKMDVPKPSPADQTFTVIKGDKQPKAGDMILYWYDAEAKAWTLTVPDSQEVEMEIKGETGTNGKVNYTAYIGGKPMEDSRLTLHYSPESHRPSQPKNAMGKAGITNVTVIQWTAPEIEVDGTRITVGFTIGEKAPQILKETITEYKKLLKDTNISEDGKDVYTDEKWTDKASYEKLDSAIANAETAAAAEGITNDKCQLALYELINAYASFSNSLIDGLLKFEEFVADWDVRVTDASFNKYFAEGNAAEGIYSIIQAGKARINGLVVPATEEDLPPVEEMQDVSRYTTRRYDICGGLALYQDPAQDNKWVATTHFTEKKNPIDTYKEAVITLVNGSSGLRGMLFRLGLDENGYAVSYDTTVVDTTLIDAVNIGEEYTTIKIQGEFTLLTDTLKPHPESIQFPNENVSGNPKAGDVAMIWLADDGWHLDIPEHETATLTIVNENGRNNGYLNGKKLVDTRLCLHYAKPWNRPSQPVGMWNWLGVDEVEVVNWKAPAGQTIALSAGSRVSEYIAENLVKAKKLLDDTPVSEDGSDVPYGQNWVTKDYHDRFAEAIDEIQAILDNPDSTAGDLEGALYLLAQVYGGNGTRNAWLDNKYFGSSEDQDFEGAYDTGYKGVGFRTFAEAHKGTGVVLYSFIDNSNGLLADEDAAKYFADGDIAKGVEKILNEGKVLINGKALPKSADDTAALADKDAREDLSGFAVNGLLNLYQNADGTWTQTVHKGVGQGATFEEARSAFFEGATKMSGLTTELLDTDGDGICDTITKTIKETIRVAKITENADKTIKIDRGNFELGKRDGSLEINDIAIFTKEAFDPELKEGDMALYWYAADGWHIEKAESENGLLTDGEDHGYYIFNDNYLTDCNITKYYLAKGNRPGQYMVAHLALGLQDEEVTMWKVGGYPFGFTSPDAKAMLTKAIANAEAIADKTVIAESGAKVKEDQYWQNAAANEKFLKQIDAAKATLAREDADGIEMDLAIYDLSQTLPKAGEALSKVTIAADGVQAITAKAVGQENTPTGPVTLMEDSDFYKDYFGEDVKAGLIKLLDAGKVIINGAAMAPTTAPEPFSINDGESLWQNEDGTWGWNTHKLFGGNNIASYADCAVAFINGVSLLRGTSFEIGLDADGKAESYNQIVWDVVTADTLEVAEDGSVKLGIVTEPTVKMDVPKPSPAEQTFTVVKGDKQPKAGDMILYWYDAAAKAWTLTVPDSQEVEVKLEGETGANGRVNYTAYINGKAMEDSRLTLHYSPESHRPSQPIRALGNAGRLDVTMTQWTAPGIEVDGTRITVGFTIGEKAPQILADTIDEYEAELEAVKVSEDGSDVAVTDKWVDAKTHDAFAEAIEEAKTVAATEGITNDKCQLALYELIVAYASFNKAKPGTKTIEEYIAEAEEAKKAAEAAKAEAEAAKGDAAAAREAQAKAEAAQKAAEEAQKIAEEKLAALEAAQKPSDEPQNVPAGMFPDVMDASKPYYKPVYWAVGRGIVQGYKNGNFGPADSCTRAQFVTMLWRFAGRPASNAAVSFTDVDSSMSSYRAIQWAVGEGIIQGYKDNTFKPQGTTTRRQVAVMLWRMQGKPSASQAAPFTDVETSDSAYRAIQWGAEAGVVKGSKAADGTTQFKPDDLCQRQQIVTFLYRFARDVMGEDVNK